MAKWMPRLLQKKDRHFDGLADTVASMHRSVHLFLISALWCFLFNKHASSICFGQIGAK